MKKKENIQLQELDIKYRIRKNDNLTKTIINLGTYGIRWVGLVIIVYYISNSIISLAGRNTDASIVFKVLADLNANQWFCIMAGGGGVGYGYLQRKSKGKYINNSSKRIDELERKLNPDKKSSLINCDGTTNKEDKKWSPQ